jgi:hypothetical protein
MKKTLLLIVIASSAFLSFAQPVIFNSSFENWESRYTKSAPIGWQTDSAGVTNGSIKKISTASAGNSSIQIGTTTYQGNVISSFIKRDDSLTSTPQNLSFDYMVLLNNTSQFNSLYVEIYFFDSKKKDLRDFNWSSSGNNTKFISANIPLTFNSGEVPKYYTLRISYFNVGGISGEYAIIDNLKFAKPAGVLKTLTPSDINVYPNPAIGTLNFSNKANDKLARVRLISTAGQNFEFPVTNSSIDISSVSKGIYLAELIDANNQILKREKVSVLN